MNESDTNEEPERSILSSAPIKQQKFEIFLSKAEEFLIKVDTDYAQITNNFRSALDILYFAYGEVVPYQVITVDNANQTFEIYTECIKILNQFVDATDYNKKTIHGEVKGKLLMFHRQLQKLGHLVWGEQPEKRDLNKEALYWDV